MQITNIVAVSFISLLVIGGSCFSENVSSHKIAATQQNDLGHQEPVNTHALSRAKRHIGYYGYGLPYYGLYRRPYPVPLPILIGGGGFVVGRGFGGRGFGGRGFGGRGFGGRGFGGRGFGGRGIGGRGGIGGGRGGRG